MDNSPEGQIFPYELGDRNLLYVILMHRRQFVTTAGSAVFTPLAAAQANAFFELRYYHMRNGHQTQRTADFLRKYFMPAAQRSGIGPIGFFGAVIAEGSPFVLSLISYPSAAAFAEIQARLAADKEFQAGFDDYNSMTELSYIRMENSLLRAFDSVPELRVPAAGARPRIFELRTYESNNLKAARKKIQMFNEGESAIFQRLGMAPVFFGETIVGRNLPNLTYMLSFEDMPARDKLWGCSVGMRSGRSYGRSRVTPMPRLYRISVIRFCGRWSFRKFGK